MLFLTILLIFSNINWIASSNPGSVLFTTKHNRDCWNEDEVARLRARKIFESIALPIVPPDKVSSKYVKETVRYFRKALRIVDKNVDPHTGAILKEALADTIGGHLRTEILPSVRLAYYAGYVPYRQVRRIHDFFLEIKSFLNTQGLGWKSPTKGPTQSNLTVGKILIGSGKLFDPCSCLITKRDSNGCIHLPCPQVDDYDTPSAIALPFKSGGLVSLSSPSSENILLKFYTTASRCILQSSPETCRHSDFVTFNNDMWHWMKRDIAPHLVDETLYAAFGGVLRIAAAVQNYGKGLSRRNLYDNDITEDTKWHPWKSLTQSYIYINTDWTPQLYVGVILLVGLTICLLQMCYNYIFGPAGGCNCKDRRRSSDVREIAYANVDSCFPAVLPNHSSAPSSSGQKRDTKSLPKSKSASVGTFRTQRVYDMNDNIEKLMSVIMSDYEGSDIETSLASKPESDTVVRKSPGDKESARSRLTNSPPKIETPMAQLKIEKTPRSERPQLPMYSTSTITRSEVTYCQEHSDTAWSGTSTSGRTCSSTSTKTQSRRSRRSRDLSWARRVVSKRNVSDQTTKSNTGTDMDLNSFTTPPSRR